MRGNGKLLLLGTYYLLYGFIYAGWLIYGLKIPPVFRDSTNYTVFLFVMGSLFFVPVVLRPFSRRCALYRAGREGDGHAGGGHHR